MEGESDSPWHSHTPDRNTGPLEGTVSGIWSAGIVEQSQGEGCCWLQRSKPRGHEAAGCGGKCLWGKSSSHGSKAVLLSHASRVEPRGFHKWNPGAPCFGSFFQCLLQLVVFLTGRYHFWFPLFTRSIYCTLFLFVLILLRGIYVYVYIPLFKWLLSWFLTAICQIKKFLETNDKLMTTQDLWDAAKAALRGKFIAIQSYLKKQEKPWIDYLTLHLKQLGKRTKKVPKLAEGKKS